MWSKKFIVRVNGDEGTPVPIPNTVVKLIYGDNTWLETAREDNSTRTSKRQLRLPFFCIVKLLARRVVQKKAIADNVKIKTPFAIIKVRSANCIKKAKGGHSE